MPGQAGQAVHIVKAERLSLVGGRIALGVIGEERIRAIHQVPIGIIIPAKLILAS